MTAELPVLQVVLAGDSSLTAKCSPSGLRSNEALVLEKRSVGGARSLRAPALWNDSLAAQRRALARQRP